MKKMYKLTDRNLIRSFGKIQVSLDEAAGERLVRAGKAINAITPVGERKSMNFPPQHKAIFHPPEEKIFSELGDVKYPGPNDRLFPHIAK
jgi:hypothetical protein